MVSYFYEIFDYVQYFFLGGGDPPDLKGFSIGKKDVFPLQSCRPAAFKRNVGGGGGGWVSQLKL